jgi:hypothetical protein
VNQLCTAPGIGPVTAVAFVVTLDDVTRFRTAHQVEGDLGLTPREYSSGERQHRGRISKTGNARMRSLLVEAAWRLLRTKDPAAAPLRAWAEGIAQRRGRSIAAVALARRLAGVLYAMWRDAAARSDPQLRGRGCLVTESAYRRLSGTSRGTGSRAVLLSRQEPRGNWRRFPVAPSLGPRAQANVVHASSQE